MATTRDLHCFFLFSCSVVEIRSEINIINYQFFIKQCYRNILVYLYPLSYHFNIFQAAVIPSFPLQFQCEYVQLRASLLEGHCQLIRTCNTFRTCPPPAIASALAIANGQEITRCGQIVSQVRTCNTFRTCPPSAIASALAIANGQEITRCGQIVSQVRTCNTFRTCPPPAIASALAIANGQEITRCGQIVSQVRTCNTFRTCPPPVIASALAIANGQEITRCRHVHVTHSELVPHPP